MGGAWLRAFAEKVGASSGTTIKEDPRPFLQRLPAGGRRAVAAGKEVALPSPGFFGGCHARLLATPKPLSYLTDTRGVALDVIKREQIGWDGKRLVFPMRHNGALVAAKTRLPRAGFQMRSWKGHGRSWPLYPEPNPGWAWLLLVAGEFDALVGRSHGLPACSVTIGAGRWREQWTDDLRPFFVAVLFDNNEREQARGVVDRLRTAGISARQLDLRLLGLRDAKGDLSDYLNNGGCRVRIRRAATGGRRS